MLEIATKRASRTECTCVCPPDVLLHLPHTLHCYSPTLNWDVLSSGSACSFTSIMCRMPKEFWIPKMDPLHQVAASTTSQPKPPSGGTNWCPDLSDWIPASESEAGETGGLHPASIICTVLSSCTIWRSLPGAWSLLPPSASRGASPCSTWGSAVGCSVRHSPLDGCAGLSNPLIPMLSAVVLRLLWALGAHAWDIGHWHKSADGNTSFDWLSVKRQTILDWQKEPLTRCS